MLPHLLSGGYLLSQVVSNQVPSALRALTSVFGMVTGVSLLLLLPHFLITIILQQAYLIKFSTYQYSQAQSITTLTLTAYLPCGLQGVLLKGNLILRGASCLDAFSSYPFQTQLLSYATGVTTHKPLVCPSRSSRTKDSSFQISYAHDGQGPNCLATF